MIVLRSRTARSDQGFGLVEIVVSMLILGLLAISFLPLLIQGVRVAADNKVLASATQLLQDQIEQARAMGTCSAVKSLDGTGIAAVNVDFTIDRIVSDADDPTDTDACPSAYPGVIKLEVKIFAAASGEMQVDAVTLVFVEAP